MKYLLIALTTMVLFSITLFANQTEKEISEFDKRVHPNSKALYKGLVESGISPNDKLFRQPIVAYNVGCGIDYESQNGEEFKNICVLSDRPVHLPGVKTYEVRGKAADEMKDALHSLMVNQGDSGAETSYLQCSFDPNDELRQYRCFAAQAVECENIYQCNIM